MEQALNLHAPFLGPLRSAGGPTHWPFVQDHGPSHWNQSVAGCVEGLRSGRRSGAERRQHLRHYQPAAGSKPKHDHNGRQPRSLQHDLAVMASPDGVTTLTSAHFETVQSCMSCMSCMNRCRLLIARSADLPKPQKRRLSIGPRLRPRTGQSQDNDRLSLVLKTIDSLIPPIIAVLFEGVAILAEFSSNAELPTALGARKLSIPAGQD